MAEKEELKVRWIQGGCQRCPSFINTNQLCFPCGNFVKFFCSENKLESSFLAPGDGIGCIACNIVEGVVAIAEMCLNPSIYIATFPSFKVTTKLKDGTQVEYLALEFAENNFLISLGGIPDYLLILWNTSTQEKLHIVCIQSLTIEPLRVDLTVSPISGRELCLTHPKGITFIEIEVCDKNSKLLQKTLYPPLQSDRVGNTAIREEDASSLKCFSGNPDASWCDLTDVLLDLPLASATGLPENELLDFYDYYMRHVRLIPSCHCWLPEGGILVCCSSGTFFKVDADHNKVKVLYQIESTLIGDQTEDKGPVNSIALHRDGLFIGKRDGTVEIFDISKDEWTALKIFTIGQSIEAISFSPNYDKLAIYTMKGSIFSYSPEIGEDAKCLLGGDTSPYIGLGCYRTNIDYCVTLRKSGLVQVWNLKAGLLVSTLRIEEMAESFALSPLCNYAVVGSSSGFLYILDLSQMSQITLTHVIRPYRTPIQFIKIDNFGKYIITGSGSEALYIYSGLPSTRFQLLGNIDMKGQIITVSVFSRDTSKPTYVIVLSTDEENPTKEGNIIMKFILPYDFLEEFEKYQANLLSELAEDYLEIEEWELQKLASDIIIHSKLGIFAYCPENCELLNIPLWEKRKKSEGIIMPKNIYSTTHSSGKSYLVLSPGHQWLASIGEDGKLFIMNPRDVSRTLTMSSHNSWKGGGSCVGFSAFEDMICTGGFDGTLLCFTFKNRRSSQTAGWVLHCQKKCKEENQHLQNFGKVDFRISDALTSKEEIIRKVEEQDREHNIEKINKLKTKLDRIERKLNKLIEENEQLPPESRLPPTSFALDPDMLDKLLQEGKKKVKMVEEQLKKEMAEKEKLASDIKRECWDNMMVKGRSLKSFHTSVVVNNYPLSERSKQDLEELNRVILQREIEIHSEELIQAFDKKETESATDFLVGDLPNKDGIVNMFTGSLRSLFDISSPYLYSQFEILTPEQKGIQIVLLKDIIYKVKVKFNKKFDSSFEVKQSEITRVAERNNRLKEIAAYLNIECEMWQPQMDGEEKPETLLKVEDHEVKVEKFYTEEELKLLKEREEEEERRRLQEGGSLKEMALMKMMGGMLESRKEDILNKELKPPTFMKEKPQAEWTKEEAHEAREFEKSVKEFQEEKEKFARNIKTEFENVKINIKETTESFDRSLQALYEEKLLADFIIYQEEMKMFILTLSNVVDEELNKWEDYMKMEIAAKEEQQLSLNPSIARALQTEAIYRKTYEEIQSQDKILDNQAKRELKASLQWELLYRIYRKRPRPKAGQATSPNPYTTHNVGASPDNLDDQFAELDSIDNCPDDIDDELWKKLCELRKKKHVVECELKQKALELAEMSSVLQKKEAEKAKLQEEIKILSKGLKKIHDLSLKFQYNNPIQLVIRQEYVEIDIPDTEPNFKSSILVHKAAINEPNMEVKRLGEKKLAAMKEIQHVHQAIRQLQWQQEHLQMELEDLQQLFADIQTFRVSRDMRRFLNGDKDFNPNTKIEMLEKAIDMQRKYFQKQLSLLEEEYDSMCKQIENKKMDNKKLEREVENIYVEISEKRLLLSKDEPSK